ncbi:hypothetical protein [Porphyromonas canoris]|nr:hypothetical protein [Porphyromonas canoris]
MLLHLLSALLSFPPEGLSSPSAVATLSLTPPWGYALRTMMPRDPTSKSL